jgi:hypothetical protein
MPPAENARFDFVGSGPKKGPVEADRAMEVLGEDA